MSFTSTRIFFVTVIVFLVDLLMMLFISPAVTAPSSIQQLSPPEIRVIIQQAKETWVGGNAVAFAALFTEDGELIVPGQRWQGRSAIEKEAANFAKQFSVAIEIQKVIVEDNQAVVAWDWKETPKAGGSPRQTQDAILIEFETGHIRRWREYIDAETPTIRS